MQAFHSRLTGSLSIIPQEGMLVPARERWNVPARSLTRTGCPLRRPQTSWAARGKEGRCP